jgi:hypothetical protein
MATSDPDTMYMHKAMHETDRHQFKEDMQSPKRQGRRSGYMANETETGHQDTKSQEVESLLKC